ncbi:MAG: sensor histidine kinase [Brevinematia bacterium]
MKDRFFVDTKLKIFLVVVFALNFIGFVVLFVSFSFVALFFEIALLSISSVSLALIMYLSRRVGVIFHFIKKILPNYHPLLSIGQIDKFVIKNFLIFRKRFLELYRENAILFEVFNNLDNVGIILLNSNNQIIFYNTYIEKFFELSQNCFGKSLSSIFTLAIVKISLDDSEQEVEVVKEGKIKTLRIFIRNIKENKLIYFFDITELKELHKTTQLTMSIISHELNTPITSISLALENILFSGKVSQEIIDVTLSNIYRLTNTISNIISLSNIYSSKVILSKSRFDILELIDSITKSLIPTYKNKHIKLNLNVEGDTNFEEDREKLQLILTNIIDNAMKFCNEGGEVDISVINHNEGYKITVTNTGSTINDEEKEKIFDMFYRGKGSSTKGSGLGLYIVKLLSNILSLKVSVFSENNRTSFVLEKL